MPLALAAIFELHHGGSKFQMGTWRQWELI